MTARWVVDVLKDTVEDVEVVAAQFDAVDCSMLESMLLFGVQLELLLLTLGSGLLLLVEGTDVVVVIVNLSDVLQLKFIFIERFLLACF